MNCRKIILMVIVACLTVLFAGSAFAANTSVGFGAARGESRSTAYTLSVNQIYEPWFGNSVVELAPTAELAGHYWKKGSDDAWGASLAPGLRLTLFSDGSFNPYIGASVGGAAMSERDLGPRDMGSHVLFKTKGVVGVEFGETNRHRLQGEYTHFSNWGLANTDDGYGTIGGSYSFSF